MSLFAASLLGITPLVPFLLYFVRTKKLELAPPEILFLVTFFATTLKYILAVTLDANLEEYYLLPGSENSVVAGVFLLTLGNAAFVFGYSALNGSAKSIGPRHDPGKSLWSIFYWPLFILSTMLLVAYFDQLGVLEDLLKGELRIRRFAFTDGGERTSLSFLAQGGSWLQVIAIAQIAMLHKLRMSGIIATLLAFFAMFVSGDRTGMIVFLGAMFVAGQLTGAFKGLSLRVYRAVVIAAVLVAVVLSGLLRTSGESAGSRGFVDSVSSGLAEAGQQYSERPYLLGPEKLQLIYETTGDGVDPLWGSSFGSLVLAPIPRVLWEDKPSVRIGQFVGTEVYLRKNRSGVPPGIVGELFLNFYWLGVVAGMLALGAWSARTYRRARQTRQGAVVYSIFLTYILIVLVVADFTGGMLQFLLAVLAVPIASAHHSKTAGLRVDSQPT